jgi:hypothetical protein
MDPKDRLSAVEVSAELSALPRKTISEASVYSQVAEQVNSSARVPLPGVQVPYPVSVVSQSASSTQPSSAVWPLLLQQLQYVLTEEGISTVKYYRNMALVATLCDEFSEDEATLGELALASNFAAASKALHSVINSQGTPTAEQKVETLLAQTERAIPEIVAAQSAAKSNKDFAKAAELQELRCDNFTSLMRMF